MTLLALFRMRRQRAKPSGPIILTADASVHAFCDNNDLAVIWSPELGDDTDLRALHGLDVWLIDTQPALIDRVLEIKPLSIWCAGFFGFAQKINLIIGRRVVLADEEFV